MNRLALLVILGVGFAATLAQVVLMRELVVSFYGNEISLGLMLAAWLVCTGLGSLVMGRIADRWLLGRGTLFGLLSALAVLVPAVVLGARLVRFVSKTSGPGEIVGFGQIATLSLAVVAPVCLLNGALFSFLCRMAAPDDARRSNVGRLYLFESLGAVLGGVVFSLILVRNVPALASAFLAAITLSAAAFAVCTRDRWLTIFPLFLLSAFVCGVVFSRDIDRWSAQLLWQPFSVRDVVDSPYGRLTFLEYGGQGTVLSNGHIVASWPPGPYAEDLVHFALLPHEMPVGKPLRVLLVGGGLSGAVREALKYSPVEVEYVELDSMLLSSTRKVFPEWLTDALGNGSAGDSPVRVHFGDGRELVESAARGAPGAPAPYDAILVDVPPPQNVQLNRYYTVEFFRASAAALAEGGVLAFRVPASDAYVSPILREFLQSIRRSVESPCPACGAMPVRPAAGGHGLFNVSVVPGSPSIFLCSRGERRTLDANGYFRQLDSRGIATDYFVGSLSDKLRPGKVEFFDALTSDGGAAALNTDLRPVCYYYDAVLWSSLFRLHGTGGEGGAYGIGRLLIELRKTRAWWFIAVLGLITLALGVLGRCVRRLQPHYILVAMAAAGFAEITAEILCLISFQAVHGTVYYLVSGVVAAFMCGLVLGAAFAVRFLQRQATLRTFIILQWVIALYQMVMAVFIVALSLSAPPVYALNVGAFIGITLIAGGLGGAQFPLAAALYAHERAAVGARAGALYGFDLLGSSVGAVVSSAILVPLIGVVGTAFAAAVLVGCSAALLMISQGG